MMIAFACPLTIWIGDERTCCACAPFNHQINFIIIVKYLYNIYCAPASIQIQKNVQYRPIRCINIHWKCWSFRHSTTFEMIGLIFLAGLLAVNGSPESRQASMGIQVCTGPGNCQVENTGVVLDFNWYGCGDPYNCYTVSYLFSISLNCLLKIL